MRAWHLWHSGVCRDWRWSYGICPQASKHSGLAGPVQNQFHQHRPSWFRHAQLALPALRFLFLIFWNPLHFVFFKLCRVRFQTKSILFNVLRMVVTLTPIWHSSFNFATNDVAVSASSSAHVLIWSRWTAFIFEGAPLRCLSYKEEKPSNSQFLRRS